MSTTRERLDYFLGAAYQADVINGHAAVAVQVLAQRLAADQDLSTAATEYLSEITDDICQRDFISKKCREYLKAALATQITQDNSTTPSEGNNG